MKKSLKLRRACLYMRLFIAIDLPIQMKRTLLGLQNALKANAKGRMVPLENFHITLHFIGESDALSDAVSAMQAAIRGIRPFNLHLSGYDTFRRSDSITSIVRIGGDLDELSLLYESLQSSMYDHGFSREYKRFSPHITLARSVIYNSNEAEKKLFGSKVNASMQVREITLFESRRTPHGMQYIPLHREKLY